MGYEVDTCLSRPYCAGMLGNFPVMATIPAEDMARARTFYTEKLGRKIADEPDDGATVFEAANGTRIFMYTRG